MKRKLFFTVVAAVFLITGCSNQPNLENAQNANKQTAKVQQKQNEANSTASVNTQNAEVQTQTIPGAASVSVNTNNQEFAKKVANIVVYFDFDKYNIRKDQWPKVEKLAKILKSNSSNYTIRIEGNCDEWGTEEYNYALGLKRANTVKNALIKLGVDPKKLTVISYGELNPVCKAHARWCWRLNRRDNFTYLP